MENDRAFAGILNDCLDAIDAEQASVEDCLARYPRHAERLESLLRLSDEAKRMPLPTPTPEMLTAGEQQLLQAVRSETARERGGRMNRNPLVVLSERLIEPAKARMRSWPKWAVPAMAASGGIALLFACVLVATLGAGATWWAFRGREGHPDEPSVIQGRSPLPTPETNVAQSPISTPDLETTHTVFLPSVMHSLPPEHAKLEGIRGVVETQADDSEWAPASEGQIIEAGQRVRTSALSSAQIAFYDGSVATVGPSTEISVDHLGQDPDDGSRIIELTQWVGETDHDVMPAYGDNARYEVHTPSGSGEAMGTFFHVLVTPALFARFSVDKGVVAVTNLDITVVVVAGQLTTIPVDQPPSEPVFRVTGEGQVAQVGSEWRIAEHVFSTHDRTMIVGNPQVGDWVSVDGHLLPDGTQVADRIVLLRRSPENLFTISGEVEAIAATSWIVAGQAISVTEETDIQEGIQVKDTVRVEGVIQDDGTLLARSIHLIEERGLPFGFVGVVGDTSDAYWVISGISVTVDADTAVEDGLAVGDTVRVRGTILAGDTWLARSIKRLAHRERKFEFVGTVDRIDRWVVSGIAFETRDWTEIEGEIVAGDRVEVEGRILADGTWVADEIELLDEKALRFKFVGMVSSTDLWVVGGVPLVVDDDTKVKGHIAVGMLVKVKGRILRNGTWLATEIKPASAVGRGRGCFTLGVWVIDASPRQILLHNGRTIDLDGGITVQGEVVVNSFVLLQICVDDDGTINVVSVIVILAPPPPPLPLPPGVCGPCSGGVTYLTLRYVGIVPNAHILVLGKKSGLLFNGIVQPGGTFSLGGTGKHGKLDKEIVVVVNGMVNTRVHTSCSRPINPGVVYGDLQVVAGYSVDGGLFCPEPVPSSPPGGDKGGSKKGGSKKGGSKN